MKFRRVDREDGRVELACEHGVGHPSHNLTEARKEMLWQSWCGVHGCDGCCSRPEFAQAENRELVKCGALPVSALDKMHHGRGDR